MSNNANYVMPSQGYVGEQQGSQHNGSQENNGMSQQQQQLRMLLQMQQQIQQPMNTVPNVLTPEQQRFLQQRQLQMEQAINVQFREKIRAPMDQIVMGNNVINQQYANTVDSSPYPIHQAQLNSQLVNGNMGDFNNINNKNANLINNNIKQQQQYMAGFVDTNQQVLSEDVPRKNVSDLNFTPNMEKKNTNSRFECKNSGQSSGNLTYNNTSNGGSDYIPASELSYPIRKHLANIATLKIYELVNVINASTSHINLWTYWKKHTSRLFSELATISYSRNWENEFVQYDLSVSALGSLFVALSRQGVVRVETVVPHLCPQVLSNGYIFFNCPRFTFTYHFIDGSYITHFAQVKGVFNPFIKIDSIDFCIHSSVPGIEWNSLERLLGNPLIKSSFSNILGVPTKKELSQVSGKENGKDEVLAKDIELIKKLRSSFTVFNSFLSAGSKSRFETHLRLGDVMSSMKNILIYKKFHKINSPMEALKRYVNTNGKDKQIVNVSSDQNNARKENENEANNTHFQLENSGLVPSIRTDHANQNNITFVTASDFPYQPSVDNGSNGQLGNNTFNSILNTSANIVEPTKESLSPNKRRRMSGVSPLSMREMDLNEHTVPSITEEDEEPNKRVKL